MSAAAKNLDGWGISGEDFETLLEEAYNNCNSLKEIRFVEEQQARWKEFGCRIYRSESQLEWLKKLAKMD